MTCLALNFGLTHDYCVRIQDAQDIQVNCLNLLEVFHLDCFPPGATTAYSTGELQNRPTTTWARVQNDFLNGRLLGSDSFDGSINQIIVRDVGVQGCSQFV
jgi:hypothetical protein